MGKKQNSIGAAEDWIAKEAHAVGDLVRSPNSTICGRVPGSAPDTDGVHVTSFRDNDGTIHTAPTADVVGEQTVAALDDQPTT